MYIIYASFEYFPGKYPYLFPIIKGDSELAR